MVSIKSWLGDILPNRLNNCEITVKNNNATDSGYLSCILYVTLKHHEKDLELIVKKGSDIEAVRDNVPIRDFFITETFVYGKIFPLFEKFQKIRGVTDLFDSYPKYYGHSFKKNSEIIVFENLSTLGYELHDRKKGMDMQHCKLVLEAYSKLHGISFALKHQDPDNFTQLTTCLGDVFKNWMERFNVEGYILDNIQTALDSLKMHGNIELHDKYGDEMKNIKDKLSRFFNEKQEKSVILHGDNWNNNYMFKYEDGDKMNPAAVSIVDWQLAAVRSPIIDVGKFLFAASGGEELSKLEELLNYYYVCLSKYIVELGSCPDDLFSFSDLREHWRKYSWCCVFGAIQTMKLAMVDSKDAPSLDNLEKGVDYNEVFDISISSNELYYNRIKNVISVYLDNNLNPDFLSHLNESV